MEKTALIITDGAESSVKMAAAIAGELKGFTVVSVSAEEFDGTQLLAAGLCFFGAERSGPKTFSYLYTMLQHINLAGRPCAVFAGSEKAADYLRAMLHDAEPVLYPEAWLGKSDVKAWAQNVIAHSNARR